MSANTTMLEKIASAGQSAMHDRPKNMNRYSGGHNRDSQPFISGYWYLAMLPPPALFGGAVGQHEAAKWFHSTAESFTPPSKTVTKVDVPGMGGVASSFAAGQELSRTFTVAFREHQDLPIMKALHLWTNMIDSNSGTSALKEFVPNEYKGQCIAVLARPGLHGPGGMPAVEQIDQLFIFEGVFPETLPYDSFNADIATNDTVQISTTFSFDGFPRMKDNPAAITEYLTTFALLGLNGSDIDARDNSAAVLPPYKQTSAFSEDATTKN